MSSLGALFDVARRAGLLDPRRLPSLTASVVRWGPTLAAPYAASALARPDDIAVIDDDGAVTFRDLDAGSTALAKGMRSAGVRRGDRLGLMSVNHRDFVGATVAAAKLGVGVVHLNTGFAAPQLAEVIDREEITGLVIDADFLHLLEGNRPTIPVFVADARSGRRWKGHRPLDDLRADSGRWSLPLPASIPVPPVLLTSGTTGTPKGARRTNRIDASAATGVVERIPYRHDDVVAITSPLFHAWGLAQMTLAATIGATIVVSRAFDPAATLTTIEREDVTVLAVVPVILQRLLAAPGFDDADLSSLRIVASSGSALPVPVVVDWLDRGGPNLYNLYGSTEVGQATLADPDDLVREPSTAGRVLPGSVVKILDDEGDELPVGGTGRIFVGNGAQFDGYTGGGGKEIVAGLMSSGDVGHLDDDGLLYVTGRADDMIVSGGENVFPGEVEDLLLDHPEIDDVAVVGVADDDFGQRLAAHVVCADGSGLTKKAVKSLVGRSLARHKVPRDVHFVDELPRTPTGKLRRNRL